ncbi:NB-ARC domain-containing protein [Microbispora sp. NBC_01189]|uniref:AfsR/SARP family transcriptional regulator n=1 Tax=Microbispora sp. NBC_01189 TaxID=2903583 RepID=UPI002E0DF7AC|nr:NB-ARC domain-containing protein [Microbispora sp. NBC_01189]
MTKLRFEVLGPVRAWCEGTELELGSPQQRAILGVLLLRAGAPASSEDLINAIWGETMPRAAPGMVRSYVYRLRHVLAAGGEPAASVIKSVPGGYALPVESIALDLTIFQLHLGAAREAHRAGDAFAEAAALRGALALWKGTPLAGVHGEYAENERIRLIQLRLATIEDRVAVDIELGRHAEAADELATLIAEEPLRERPRELLMLAYYRSGRQADALAVFHETRNLLDEQLGIEPGPGLKEMQQRILNSDPTLLPAATPTPSRPVTVQQPIPAQLPPDLPDFVGRAELRDAVVSALTARIPSVPVVGLTGLDGIGKTTLAVNAGHAVAEEFPGGQFFVEFDDTDRSCMDPGAVLGSMLRSLGVPEETLPAATVQRSALWRTTTAGRRILVVLDNPPDERMVQQLLPGSSGAAVMITTWQRFTRLAGVQWMKVGELPEEEGLALFEQIIGQERVAAEPAAARRLIHQTAGLPHAIRALAARLADRPSWRLTTMFEREDGRRPDTPERLSVWTVVDEPFERAFRELSPEQARALRLAAIPDGPDVSLPAAATALDRPIFETENLLEALADVHLLEPTSLGRYRYHHPVRHFARNKAWHEDGEAGKRAALGRLVRFYLASVRAALRAIDELPSTVTWAQEPGPPTRGLTFPNAEAARSWFLLEQEHIRAIATQSANHAEAEADLLTSLLGLLDPPPQAAIG